LMMLSQVSIGVLKVMFWKKGYDVPIERKYIDDFM